MQKVLRLRKAEIAQVVVPRVKQLHHKRVRFAETNVAEPAAMLANDQIGFREPADLLLVAERPRIDHIEAQCGEALLDGPTVNQSPPRRVAARDEDLAASFATALA